MVRIQSLLKQLGCLACLSWGLWLTGPAFAQLQTPPTDLPTFTFLTKTTIVALNHANRTGNYAVLRDIGTPSFSANNSPADLALAFTDLRNRNLDLSPIVLFDPQFVRPPEIDRLGRLNMIGYFPSSPLRINFEMIFEPVDGRWRLFGLSVNPVQAPAVNADPLTAQTDQPSPQEPVENTGAALPVPRINPERFNAD